MNLKPNYMILFQVPRNIVVHLCQCLPSQLKYQQITLCLFMLRDLIVLNGIGQLKTDFQTSKEIPISTKYIIGRFRSRSRYRSEP